VAIAVRFSLVVIPVAIPLVSGAIERLWQRIKNLKWPFSNADILPYTDFDALVGE